LRSHRSRALEPIVASPCVLLLATLPELTACASAESRTARPNHMPCGCADANSESLPWGKPVVASTAAGTGCLHVAVRRLLVRCTPFSSGAIPSPTTPARSRSPSRGSRSFGLVVSAAATDAATTDVASDVAAAPRRCRGREPRIPDCCWLSRTVAISATGCMYTARGDCSSFPPPGPPPPPPQDKSRVVGGDLLRETLGCAAEAAWSSSGVKASEGVRPALLASVAFAPRPPGAGSQLASGGL